MVYLIPLVLLLIGAVLYDKKGISKGNFLYWLSCLTIILIFGFRYRVGGDTLNYMYKYNLLPNLSEANVALAGLYDVEIGFFYLESFVKTVFDSFYGVQVIESLFVNVVIFWFAKNRTSYKFSFALIYFLLLSFYFNTEIMREAIAVSFFLLGINQYENGRKSSFYLFMIGAVLFHYSSIFLLLYPILHKILKNTKLTLIYGSVALIVLSVGSIPMMSGYLGTKIANNMNYQFTVWGELSVFLKFVVLPCFVVYLYRRFAVMDRNAYKNDVHFLYVYMFYGMLTLGPFSILMRLLNYLNPIFFIVIIRLFTSWKPSLIRSKGISKFCMSFALFIFFLFPYLRDTSHILKGTHFYCLWFPYYSILDEQEDPSREAFVVAQFEKLHDAGL